jgi:hypothetical protein
MRGTSAEQNVLLMPLGCSAPLQAFTPSTTQRGQPGSRGAAVATTMASSVRWQPVNVTFEFGDLLLSPSQV